MNGDVETLVVHPALLDASAEVCFRGTHTCAQSVPGTARWINDDVVCQVVRTLLWEAKFHKEIRNVFLVSLGSRIPLRHDLIELRFRICPARAKTVVPDIEWLDRPAQARFNQLGN